MSFVAEFLAARLRIGERVLKAEDDFVEQALLPSVGSLMPSVVDTIHELVLNFK